MDGQTTWAVVLAGGDGYRLRALTTDSLGNLVPKQFCSINGGQTLLETALARAERLAPTERILVSVAGSHRDWWCEDLLPLPNDNIVVQPSNRGTLAGLVLPLLEIYARDPAARVIVLPSDHFVTDEPTLESSARAALKDLERTPNAVVLLGIEPRGPDPDYGWIVPDPTSADDVRKVVRFAEKPSCAEATRLMGGGALLNSFIFCARAARLLDLCLQLEPLQVWSLRLGRWHEGDDDPPRGLADVYSILSTLDFSRDVLQKVPQTLLVRAVPECGWSDLGTLSRVACWCKTGRGSTTSRLRAEREARPILARAFFGNASSSPVS